MHHTERIKPHPAQLSTAFVIRLCVLMAYVMWASAVSLPKTWAMSSARSSIAQAAPNLVANANFEAGLASWQACGGAALSDAQTHGKSAARGGRYAVEFRAPTRGDECPEQPDGYSYLTRTPQAVWQDIAIPSTAVSLTLSFWYWVEGSPDSSLAVTLGNNLYSFTNSFTGTRAADVNPYLLPGWTLYRVMLSATDVQKLKGRSVKLGFHLDDPLVAGDAQVMRIDEVRLAAVAETNTASPLPSDLRSDGSTPLAVVRYAANTGPTSSYTHLYRLNTDGSGLKQIYSGTMYSVGAGYWSHNGQTLAVIETEPYPPGPYDPDRSIFTSQLVLMKPDGANSVSLYHLSGLHGSVCPGDVPSFIQKFTRLSWSPNDETIAASIFAYNQYCNGTLGGGLARVETVIAATGSHTLTLDYATSATWGPNNDWLFEAYDLSGGSRNDGIWRYTPTSVPPTDTQLLSGKGFDDDDNPIWSPDGQFFATTRPTGSPNPFGGRNWAIMLFDRQDLQNPRMLLLADHGSSASARTFSPDGKYLLYTLQSPGVKSGNLWWLNVATMETGPITTEGLIFGVDWRPSATALLNRNLFLPLVRR